MNAAHTELASEIIGAAIEVHKTLGPGLLESVYEKCLTHELLLRNIQVKPQHPLPVEYKSEKLDCGYRLDLLVEDKIIVELKSIDEINNVHQAQLLTYMKLANISHGLIINFNVKLLKQGIKSMLL